MERSRVVEIEQGTQARCRCAAARSTARLAEGWLEKSVDSGNITGLMLEFELFTDGACSGNPGPGGWAFILRGGDLPRERVESGAEARTTNNRMELLAVIRGLEAVPAGNTVTVSTDSEYTVKGLSEWMDGWKARGWKKADKKPVMNVDLWKRLDELRVSHKVRPQWIRGHNEHPENERCDRMAVAAIEALVGHG